MNMEEGKNASDRELFSELFENPIHPLFIHMVPPFVDENDRMFRLQVSGEALWKWKDVCKAGTLFELLQASIPSVTSYTTRRANESETLSPEALDDFGKSYKAARTEKKE